LYFGFHGFWGFKGLEKYSKVEILFKPPKPNYDLVKEQLAPPKAWDYLQNFKHNV